LPTWLFRVQIPAEAVIWEDVHYKHWTRGRVIPSDQISNKHDLNCSVRYYHLPLLGYQHKASNSLRLAIWSRPGSYSTDVCNEGQTGRSADGARTAAHDPKRTFDQ
jgi:hypothetical protein